MARIVAEELADLPEGSLAFYLHPEESWAVGTIASAYKPGAKGASGSYDVVDKALGGNKPMSVPANTASIYPIRDQSVLTEDVDDLLNLTEIHHSTLLHALRSRYMKDVVYTYIGPIVVAINPFNYNIPWYKDDFMPNYLVEGPIIQKNKPHSWSVAHNTYYEMVNDAENQTILVSGESGAGKTEAVKIVIKYLKGLMVQRATSDAVREKLVGISDRILKASPVLESFGNAKTGRNDNSSRFGKFMRVTFEGSEREISGSAAIPYLLERSRVVTAAQGERVYHAFYQVAKGKDAAKYGITGDLKTFPSLYAGGTLDNATMEDAEGDDLSYRMSNLCLDECGVRPDFKDALWRVVAGILLLLRVRFSPPSGGNDASEGATLSAGSDALLDQVCSLWKVPVSDLTRELLETTTEVRGETFTVKHSVARCALTRTSIAQALYNGLFLWLMEVLNETTAPAEHPDTAWIGILDIFGFENFKVNSFEQLCINLANETLQNHYNDYIFSRDMSECSREGIDVASITFEDNTPTVELLTGKLGILALLDDTCAVSGGSSKGDPDESFLEKVSQQHSKHPRFEKKQLWKGEFAVAHYAATVRYTVDGMVQKNMDILKDQIKTLFRTSSTCEVTAGLLPEPVEKKGRAPTVGGIFVQQIQSLMDVINSMNPHWIRCIKPHYIKKPLHFHGQSTMSQMVSAGVMETVRIRLAGYPVRLQHDKFLVRYNILSSAKPATIESIFQAMKWTPAEAQVGHTKVFMKGAAYNALEAAKRRALHSHACCVQAWCRRLASINALKAIFMERNKELIAHLKKQKGERDGVVAAEEGARGGLEKEAVAGVEAMIADLHKATASLRHAIEERKRITAALESLTADEEKRRVSIFEDGVTGIDKFIADAAAERESLKGWVEKRQAARSNATTAEQDARKIVVGDEGSAFAAIVAAAGGAKNAAVHKEKMRRAADDVAAAEAEAREAIIGAWAAAAAALAVAAAGCAAEIDAEAVARVERLAETSALFDKPLAPSQVVNRVSACRGGVVRVTPQVAVAVTRGNPHSWRDDAIDAPITASATAASAAARAVREGLPLPFSSTGRGGGGGMPSTARGGGGGSGSTYPQPTGPVLAHVVMDALATLPPPAPMPADPANSVDNRSFTIVVRGERGSGRSTVVSELLAALPRHRDDFKPPTEVAIPCLSTSASAAKHGLSSQPDCTCPAYDKLRCADVLLRTFGSAPIGHASVSSTRHATVWEVEVAPTPGARWVVGGRVSAFGLDTSHVGGVAARGATLKGVDTATVTSTPAGTPRLPFDAIVSLVESSAQIDAEALGLVDDRLPDVPSRPLGCLPPSISAASTAPGYEGAGKIIAPFWRSSVLPPSSHTTASELAALPPSVAGGLSSGTFGPLPYRGVGGSGAADFDDVSRATAVRALASPGALPPGLSMRVANHSGAAAAVALAAASARLRPRAPFRILGDSVSRASSAREAPAWGAVEQCLTALGAAPSDLLLIKRTLAAIVHLQELNVSSASSYSALLGAATAPGGLGRGVSGVDGAGLEGGVSPLEMAVTASGAVGDVAGSTIAGVDAAGRDGRHRAAFIAWLLGVDATRLVHTLTHTAPSFDASRSAPSASGLVDAALSTAARSVSSRGLFGRLSPEAACWRVASLCMALYEGVFEKVVEVINRGLARERFGEKGAPDTYGARAAAGRGVGAAPASGVGGRGIPEVVDVAIIADLGGTEDDTYNTLPQLLRNATADALHGVFTHHVFAGDAEAATAAPEGVAELLNEAASISLVDAAVAGAAAGCVFDGAGSVTQLLQSSSVGGDAALVERILCLMETAPQSALGQTGGAMWDTVQGGASLRSPRGRSGVDARGGGGPDRTAWAVLRSPRGSAMGMGAGGLHSTGGSGVGIPDSMVGLYTAGGGEEGEEQLPSAVGPLSAAYTGLRGFTLRHLSGTLSYFLPPSPFESGVSDGRGSVTVKGWGGDALPWVAAALAVPEGEIGEVVRSSSSPAVAGLVRLNHAGATPVARYLDALRGVLRRIMKGAPSYPPVPYAASFKRDGGAVEHRVHPTVRTLFVHCVDALSTHAQRREQLETLGTFAAAARAARSPSLRMPAPLFCKSFSTVLSAKAKRGIAAVPAGRRDVARLEAVVTALRSAGLVAAVDKYHSTAATPRGVVDGLGGLLGGPPAGLLGAGAAAQGGSSTAARYPDPSIELEPQPMRGASTEWGEEIFSPSCPEGGGRSGVGGVGGTSHAPSTEQMSALDQVVVYLSPHTLASAAAGAAASLFDSAALVQAECRAMLSVRLAIKLHKLRAAEGVQRAIRTWLRETKELRLEVRRRFATAREVFMSGLADMLSREGTQRRAAMSDEANVRRRLMREMQTDFEGVCAYEQGVIADDEAALRAVVVGDAQAGSAVLYSACGDGVVDLMPAQARWEERCAFESEVQETRRQVEKDFDAMWLPHGTYTRTAETLKREAAAQHAAREAELQRLKDEELARHAAREFEADLAARLLLQVAEGARALVFDEGAAREDIEAKARLHARLIFDFESMIDEMEDDEAQARWEVELDQHMSRAMVIDALRVAEVEKMHLYTVRAAELQTLQPLFEEGKSTAYDRVLLRHVMADEKAARQAISTAQRSAITEIALRARGSAVALQVNARTRQLFLVESEYRAAITADESAEWDDILEVIHPVAYRISSSLQHATYRARKAKDDASRIRRLRREELANIAFRSQQEKLLDEQLWQQLTTDVDRAFGGGADSVRRAVAVDPSPLARLGAPLQARSAQVPAAIRAGPSAYGHPGGYERPTRIPYGAASSSDTDAAASPSFHSGSRGAVGGADVRGSGRSARGGVSRVSAPQADWRDASLRPVPAAASQNDERALRTLQRLSAQSDSLGGLRGGGVSGGGSARGILRPPATPSDGPAVRSRKVGRKASQDVEARPRWA